ncbi:DUF362 domain-containing protein [Methanocaldococcus infernus]|uniref:4Fe-4S ferredoxin iron-sulfur binding domain protein n=1 Tax=Methanocaldococcus infernus (strain DSM 11812 / JCM 15783 / ME) TaxID=573063 RepID=D5VRQ4_METIM|nr:4Fe-4S binding protein [Methanocaldococcus infernus]ADG13257.1 4Fe-4S ferredoxin iron-sulfur binding domain protein [Methanocaldococcus infernus ME]
MVKVNEKCVGCGICVPFCRKKALKTYGKLIIDKEKCINCKLCIKYCQINALEG